MTITLNITDTFTQLVNKFNELSSLVDSDTDFTSKISLTDTNSTGLLSYNTNTGVITNNTTAGNGISISSGTIALKSVSTFIIYDSAGTALRTLYAAGSL